jgi:large conductance mechanosensitive channel
MKNINHKEGKYMSFFKEFKEFAMKGNVMDLAIGVIIGTAFGKIVSSLVNDIVTPLISLITGKLDLSTFTVELNLSEDISATLKIGQFITNVIDFLIIALVIFIFIKQLNRLKPKPAPAPVTTKDCPYCRTNIHIEATKCPNCTADLK